MAPIPSNVPRSYASWVAIVANSPEFNLDAGVYGLVIAWTAGSATLQKLMPDGVTWFPVSAVFGASAYTVLQLPAGKYRLAVVTGPLTGTIELIARGGFR